MVRARAKKPTAPTRLHLDKRAEALAAEISAGDADELLNTLAAAKLLGCSTQWLEIKRHAGGGPPFVRLSPRMVRYRRADLTAWLLERSYARTSEYA
jgi:predicted DNA-binding transcriptional regulator AlpA